VKLNSWNLKAANPQIIQSCDEKNTYIATQAPLPHTFHDFYTMIWQEKCNVIVAITNLVERGKVRFAFFTLKQPFAEEMRSLLAV
jgi:protein tyrosine phosphatase